MIEARIQRKDAKNLKDLSTEQPMISYLIGQAGSGKTTLRRYISDENFVKDGECVVELDADKLAVFHKYYDELIKLPPDDFYKLTRNFVKPANKIIHKTVIDNKINVVKEKVMHKGEPDYQEVAEFKSGGYKVDMNIIALDGYESFLCCIERDISLIKNGLEPRRVTRADHDRMYTPFIQELREFAKRGLCDRINIYGRGESVDKPNLLYSNDVQSENALNVEECIKAIEDERNRMHNELIKNQKVKEEYILQLIQLEQEINNELELDR